VFPEYDFELRVGHSSNNYRKKPEKIRS